MKLSFLALCGILEVAAGAFETYTEADKDALAKYRAGKYKEAMVSYQEAMKLTSSKDLQTSSRNQLISCCYYSRDFVQMEKYLAEQLAAEPLAAEQGEITDFWQGLFLQRDPAKWDDAVKAYLRVKKRKGYSWAYFSAMYQAGMLLERQKKFAEAIGIFDELIQTPGISSSAKNNALIGKAEALGKSGKTRDAVKMFTEMKLENPPAWQSALFELRFATVLCTIREYNKALEELEKVESLRNVPPQSLAECRTLAAHIYFYYRKDVRSAKLLISKANSVPGTAGKSPALTRKIDEAFARMK